MTDPTEIVLFVLLLGTLFMLFLCYLENRKK